VKRAECQRLIDGYIEWLRSGLAAQQTDAGACELTTPFLDRHNDHLQVYAVNTNGRIVLSDDGYVLSDLRTSGLEFSTPKRRLVLETILNGLGIKEKNNELSVETSAKDLPQRLHSLIQAMLAVNDMFVMSQPRVASLFWEDVKEFFDEHDVRYSPLVKVAGKSGFDHAIDFLIPKSKSRPERLVQAISSPTKNTIGNYLWVLSDTRDGRGRESEAYAFLNDRDHTIGGDVMEALEAYSVVPAFWSKRDHYLETLAN
jgi:hypothetical protein